MDRCDALYVSPHLDDAVLSCPGRILEDVAAGRRVVVATLFSRGDETYDRRREEDRRALGLLGAEPLWLDLPDSPYRNPYYNSFRTIVLDEHHSDHPFVAEVASTIRSLWERLRPGRVHLPLAAGTHIDHRLVHRAWTALPPDANVTFYEDRPYVFLRGNLETRLREIGSPAEEIPLHDFLASLRRTRYVSSYLPPGPERFRAVLQLARRLRAPVAAEGPMLRQDLLCATSARLETITAAVGCYASQIYDLFDTMDRFRDDTSDYTRHLSPGAAYAERAWGLLHRTPH